jgi:hypothetical protein
MINDANKGKPTSTIITFDKIKLNEHGNYIMLFKGLFNTPLSLDVELWNAQITLAKNANWTEQLDELYRAKEIYDSRLITAEQTDKQILKQEQDMSYPKYIGILALSGFGLLGIGFMLTFIYGGTWPVLLMLLGVGVTSVVGFLVRKTDKKLKEF